MITRKAKPAAHRRGWIVEPLEPRLLQSADLSVVAPGLDKVLTSLQPVIVQQIERAPLPLIGGNSLAQLATLVDSGLSATHGALDGALQQVGPTSTTADLRATLFQALGPGGAKLLLNNPDDPDKGTPRLEDIEIGGSPDAPLITLELGRSLGTLNLAADSRLGLPAGLGLSLSSAASVSATLGYAVELSFGIDGAGFFVNPTPFGTGSSLANVSFDLTTPGLSASAKLGNWSATLKDDPAAPTHLSQGRFDISLIDPNNDSHFRPDSEVAKFDGRLGGEADIGLAATLDLFGNPSYPSFSTELLVKWGLGFPSDASHPETFGSVPNVTFRNVSVKLGSFLGDELNSTLSPIADIIKPAKPLLDILTAPLPVVSDLAGRSTTLLDLFGGPDARGLNIASQVSSALNLVSQVSGLGKDIRLNLGSFSFAGDDIRDPGFSLASAIPSIVGPKVNLPGQLFGWASYPGLPSLVDGKSELQLPFLTDPLKAFGVLLGQPEDLISFNPPPANFSMSSTLGPFPLVGPLVVELSAGLKFSMNLGFGYDTTGLYASAQSGSATDLAKGVFIRGSADANGNQLPVFTLTGFAQAAAAVDLVLVDAGVAGGVKATVNFSLNGANGDGKERLADLAGGPLNALSADGSLEAYARIFIDIGIGPFSVPFNLDVPLATLLDFSGGGAAPVLAQMDPLLGDGVLRLNVGAYAAARNFHPNTVDESFAVRHVGGTAGDETVMVVAFGKAQAFTHVKSIYADAGDGANTLSASGYVANEDGTFSLVPTQWLAPNPDGFGGLNLVNRDPGGFGLYPELTAVQSPLEFHTGKGRDVLVGGSGASLLDAGGERDVLIAGGGPTRMLGGDGNDLLVAGTGVDTIDGGAGTDMVSYASASAAVAVDLANATAGGAAAGDVLTNVESLQGSSFDDTLTGDDGHNVIDGRGGNDVLRGRGGNDLLIGGAGADVLDGGTGNDSLAYVNSPAAVNIDLTADLASGGDAEGDTLIGAFRGVEGSQFDDVLIGSAGADQIDGLGGNDQIQGRAGDDILNGGSGNDRIVGGQGNDQIAGGLGNDTVLGDDGSIDPAGKVTLVAGAGGDDQISGDEGDDRLYGQAGSDTINGGDGRDTIVGGAGADAIGGDAGLDTVSYFDSPSAVRVDLSTQTVSGGDADGDTLTSSFENAEGSAFNDTLIAVTRATEINQAGSTLSGLAGDDLLIAGPVFYSVLDPVTLKVYKFGDSLIGGDGSDTASWENSTSGVVANISDSMIGYSGSTAAVVLPGRGELGWAQGDFIGGVENLRGSDWSDMLIGNNTDNVIDPRLDRDATTWYYSSSAFPGVYRQSHDFVDARGGSDTLKIDYARGDTGTGLADQVLAMQNGSSFGAVARWVAGADPTKFVPANFLDFVDFQDIDRFDINGTAENDVLSGWSGDDRLHGNAGDDLIVARGGVGDLDGGSGTDTLSADLSALSAAVTIDTATTGDQFKLDSGSTHLRIAGFEVLGADGGTPLIHHLPIVAGSRFGFSDPGLWFITGSGDDHLTTHGRYRDVIVTGAGNDVVDPGLGLPVVENGFQTGWQPGDIINLGSGDDTLVLDYSLGDTGTGLSMSGDDGGNFPGNNPNSGQAGEVVRYTAPNSGILLDRVLVWGEEHVQITGTNENDVMHGTPNDDVLLGMGGDDFIAAGAGGGVLDGGSGTDILNADLSALSVPVVIDTAQDFSLPSANLKIRNFEQLGRYNPYGQGGFITGSGNDVITTHGRYNDWVFTNAGDDRANLALGLDAFSPGSGNNTAIVDYSDGDTGQAMRATSFAANATPGVMRLTADGKSLLDAVYFYQPVQNFVFTGTSKNDSLNGDAGADVLTGVNPDAAQPGLGEVDALTGGKGADLFVLGNARTAFYDDANAATGGSADYARIRDFSLVDGDRIQLHGSAADYQLVQSPGGLRIVLKKPNGEPGEMIGLIESAPVGLTLDNGFNYLDTSLQVTSFAPTASGFTLRFNHAIDLTKLNLYGGDPTNLGASDVSFVGPGNVTVSGSLIPDADRQGFTFLRTGGVLPSGNYSVTLASRANGIVTPGGSLLDGNKDGVAGDNYVAQFDVAPSTSALLGIGEIARGPGQTLATPAAGFEFPITLDNAAGASRIVFTLNYDPAMLNVSGLSGGNLPAGSVIGVDLATPGQAKISIVAGSPLGAGRIVLGNLVASVPMNAAYGAKDLLHLSNVQVDQGARAVRADDGLHVVAFLGDVTADGSYTTLDVQRMRRVLLRQDGGFGTWPLVDPLIVADVSGNGVFSSTDSLKLSLQIGGTPQKEIQPIPANLPPLVFAGADPSVTLGSVQAVAGSQVIVPVRIDTAAGLESMQLTIRYDRTALSLLEVQKTALTEGFAYTVIHNDPGELVIDTSRAAPLVAGTGDLFGLKFAVAASPSGRVAIDLASARLNDSWLTLNPQPRPGPDPTDGAITVAPPPGITPPRKSVPVFALDQAAKGFSLGPHGDSAWLAPWVAREVKAAKVNTWTVSAGQPAVV